MRRVGVFVDVRIVGVVVVDVDVYCDAVIVVYDICVVVFMLVMWV